MPNDAKIKREAVKREKDEASQKRLELINEEITALQKEIADLDEIWKAEKAQAQGSKTIMQEGHYVVDVKPRVRHHRRDIVAG